jgi:hypothetical protein
MGMFDALPDINSDPQNKSVKSSGMFDSLPDINPKGQSWPPQVGFEPTTPEEKKLAAELRTVADKELLKMAGPVAQSPIYAGVSEFANTLGLNIPRNAAAAARTLKTGRTFDQEYEFLKNVDAAAARQSPKADAAGFAGGVIGQALALAPEAAPTWIGRAAQGAGMGGGIGYASEAIDSKDAQKAAQAGLFGALGGGLGVPVVEGAGAAIRAASRPLVNTVSGLVNPEREAARRIGAGLAADFGVGGENLTAAQAAQAGRNGQELVVADFGGDVTRALARSAANTSPEARTALGNVIERRFSTQGDRTSDFIRGFGSGQSAVTTSDQLAAAARNSNKQSYARAYSDPNAQAIWNEDLAGLMQAPAVQDAIRQTMKTGANKAAAQGFKAPKNPFVEDANGNINLRVNEDGSTAIPSIQFWDYVQRNLNDDIGKLQRAGQKDAASDVISLRSQLNSVLDNTVPSFKDARAGAAKFFGAEDALQAGREFVKSTMDNAEAAKALGKMSKPERDLFAEGFVSDLVNNVRNIGDRQTVINKIYNTPNAKQRVLMALGPERAKKLEAFLHVETVADRLRNAVNSNSTTARQLAEMGLAGGGSGAMLGAGAGFIGGGGSQDISTGAIAGALFQRGASKIDARVARRVGELLASNNPDDIAKIVNMATKNKSLFNSIKNFNLKAISAFSGNVAEDANQ